MRTKPLWIAKVAAVIVVFSAGLGADIQCTEAEAQRLSLASLQTQIDELAAERDAMPVIVDSAGSVVGNLIGADERESRAIVELRLQGLPAFTVFVSAQEILSVVGLAVFFETSDCTGATWIDSAADRLWAPATTIVDSVSGERTFYVQDTNDTPEPIFVFSTLPRDGVCEQIDTFEMATPFYPVEVDSVFTPPFRVITRGDL